MLVWDAVAVMPGAAWWEIESCRVIPPAGWFGLGGWSWGTEWDEGL